MRRRAVKLATFGFAVFAFLVGKFLFDLYRVARIAPPNHSVPAQNTTAGRLKGHVEALSSQIGERNLARAENLEAAARYIESQFKKAGLDVVLLPYSIAGSGLTRNIEVRLPGPSEDAPLFIVGAHYDTAPGTPGADDNATGVAALIELAHRLKGERRTAEIRLVAFSTEEPPHFGTPDMGSARYVKTLELGSRRFIGMVSLECLGYFNDAPGSQKYPPILGWFYPDQANFIGFVSNIASRPLLSRFKKAYAASKTTPAIFAALPQNLVSTITLSDQAPFWQRGLPAIMVSDTAFLRNSSYHQASDRSERIDYARFAEVVEGLGSAVSSVVNEGPDA